MGGSFLHEIYFYKDRSGNQPVLEYLEDLAKKQDKDSRVKLNKIRDYIKILKEYGYGQYLFFEIKPEFETVLNININYNEYMTKLIYK